MSAPTITDFNEEKILTKMLGMGKDCFIREVYGPVGVRTIKGIKEIVCTTRKTIYQRKEDGSFLEYVNTPTGGSWYILPEYMIDIIKQLERTSQGSV